MDEEIKDITPDVDENIEPIEVIIKKEKVLPEPNFDYDDYSPSDTEIHEIEKEIQEKIERSTNKVGKK